MRDSRIFGYLVILGIATFLWTWLVAGFGPRPISMKATLAYSPPNRTDDDDSSSIGVTSSPIQTTPAPQQLGSSASFSGSTSERGEVIRTASVSTTLSTNSSIGKISIFKYSRLLSQSEAFDLCSSIGSEGGVLFSPIRGVERTLATSLINTAQFRTDFGSSFGWIGLYSGDPTGYYWRYGSEEAKSERTTFYSGRDPATAGSTGANSCSSCQWASGFPNITNVRVEASVLMSFADYRWYSVDASSSSFLHDTFICQYPPRRQSDTAASSSVNPLLDPKLQCDIMYAPNIWTDSYAIPEQVGGMKDIFLDHVISNGSSFTPPWRNGPTCVDFLQFPWIKFIIGVPVIGLLALAAPPLNVGKAWFPMLGFARGIAFACTVGMVGYLILLPQLATHQCAMRINEDYLEHANLVVVKYHEAEIHPLPFGSAFLSTLLVVFTLLCLICCPRPPQDTDFEDDFENEDSLENGLLDDETREERERRLRDKRIDEKRARLPGFIRAFLPDRKKVKRRTVHVEDPNDPFMRELQESENDRVWKRKSTNAPGGDGAGRKRSTTLRGAAQFMKPPILREAYTDLETYHRNLAECSPFSLSELPDTINDFEYDPRTRLPLVGIPPAKARPFSQFSKTPMHSFCNTSLVGTGQRKQRVVVASDVCIYICQTSGAIERCIPHENIKHVGLGGKDQRIVFRYEGKNDHLKADFGKDQEVCLEMENLQSCENLLKVADRCHRRLTGNLRPNMPKPKGSKQLPLIKVDRVDRIPLESVEETPLPDSGNVAINPASRPLAQLLEALRVYADDKEQKAEADRQAETREQQFVEQQKQLRLGVVDEKSRPGLASSNTPEKGTPMFGTAAVFIHIEDAASLKNKKNTPPKQSSTPNNAAKETYPSKKTSPSSTGLKKLRDSKKNTHSFYVAPEVFDDERERRPELGTEDADVETIPKTGAAMNRFEGYGDSDPDYTADRAAENEIKETAALTLEEKLFGKATVTDQEVAGNTQVDPFFSDDDTL